MTSTQAVGALQRRFKALGTNGEERGDLTGALVLQRGVMGDYHTLSRFHYRAGRPATVTRVWRLVDVRLSVVGRYLGRREAGRVAGVVVESMPTLRCRLRGVALGGRYGSIRSARERAMLMKEEVRCISRVVVHPQWRGLGLAARLIRHALLNAQTVYTEAMAAMGQVHPMFEKAGMRAYRAPPAADDARLIDALARVGMDLRFDGIDRAVEQVESLPPKVRRWLNGELARWLGHVRFEGDVGEGGWSAKLEVVARRLSGRAVYYVYDRRWREGECEGG